MNTPTSKDNPEPQGAPAAEMPRYKCHKHVHALKILAVSRLKDDADGKERIRLHFVENGYAPLIVSEEFATRHKPANGMYYVVYEDGYASVSPGEAFEKGYAIEGPRATREQLGRALHWHELDVDGKLERMRSIIKGVNRTATSAGIGVRALDDTFQKHTHSDKGILVPIERSRTMGLSAECEAPLREGDAKPPVFF